MLRENTTLHAQALPSDTNFSLVWQEV